MNDTTLNGRALGLTLVSQLCDRLKLDTVADRLSACAVLLFIQFIWLYVSLGAKIAWLNMVPGIVLVPLIVIFAANAWQSSQKQILFLCLFLLLSLRLPVSVASELLSISWLIFAVFCGMLLHWLFLSLGRQGAGKYFLVAIAIFLFNGLSHLGLESPFTHTFHLINGMPSDYAGVDNNRSWECAYEVAYFPVHCDARHFIAAERIFTEPSYDASFSVVLPRYFDGYLKSLIGTEGLRWLSSLLIHFLFWAFTCAAVFRICVLTKTSLSVARASMLATASAWGFVSMAAQPAPYFISFAFGAICIWAVLELINNSERCWQKELIYVLILVASTLTYEAYPLMVTSWGLLALFGRKGLAVLVAVLQIGGGLLWKYVGLDLILGTMGNLDSDSSGVSNISKDFHTWLNVFMEVNVSEFFRLSWVGVQAYAFGNLVYGAVAAACVTFLFYRKLAGELASRQLWWSITMLNFFVLGAALFIVPQMFHWSPSTGMQPRITFFSFPLNTVALCYLVAQLRPNLVWSVPALMFILANMDKTGFASQAMLFDYGKLGWFWY